MIKGINRQVVEVRETGNECFERILFFVKPEYAGMSEGKIREKAGLAARGVSQPPATRVKKSKATEVLKIALSLLTGIVVGIAVTVIVKG
jgi:hypothetical protein